MILIRGFQKKMFVKIPQMINGRPLIYVHVMSIPVMLIPMSTDSAHLYHTIYPPQQRRGSAALFSHWITTDQYSISKKCMASHFLLHL